MIQPSISHDWSEETPEAKAKWFRSLTVEQRMALMCQFASIRSASEEPRRKLTVEEVKRRYVHTPVERIRILERP